MNTLVAKAGFAVIAAGMALSPVAAFAHGKHVPVRRHHVAPVYAMTHNNVSTNLLDRVSTWKTNGGVSVASDGTVTLTENGSENEDAYKDVAVHGRGGDMAVFRAETKAETVRANDITGLPYLYAYAMNKDGKILAYFQGQHMLHAGTAGAWQVNGGSFRIPKGTATIRYFLSQAEKQGSSKNGDDAMFRNMSLKIVNR